MWGAFHGVALVLHRAWSGLGLRMPKALAWLLTSNFINFTWIFFSRQYPRRCAKSHTWNGGRGFASSFFRNGRANQRAGMGRLVFPSSPEVAACGSGRERILLHGDPDYTGNHQPEELLRTDGGRPWDRKTIGSAAAVLRCHVLHDGNDELYFFTSIFNPDVSSINACPCWSFISYENFVQSGV